MYDCGKFDPFRTVNKHLILVWKTVGKFYDRLTLNRYQLSKCAQNFHKHKVDASDAEISEISANDFFS